MNFVTARNLITSKLESHIGHPVILSDQIADMPDFPYCYYSVLTPRIPSHDRGLEKINWDGEGYLKTREEIVEATISFTFCGMNRETNDGYIFGEDEALELCEKAHGFFLLNAHNINDAIVIKNVGNAASRSSFLVEDTVRRYGFDIRFSYVRADEQYVEIIKSAEDPHGNLHC